jgi:hypothetical protein
MALLTHKVAASRNTEEILPAMRVNCIQPGLCCVFSLYAGSFLFYMRNSQGLAASILFY